MFLAPRHAVDLLLCFSFSSCNVERALKEVPHQERMQRAHMLATTMENLLLAQQAPPTEDMAACTGGTICPKGPYLATIIRKYMQQFGAKPAGRKLQVKPRRDAGLSKNPDNLKAQRQARGAAQPEAASCQNIWHPCFQQAYALGSSDGFKFWQVLHASQVVF